MNLGSGGIPKFMSRCQEGMCPFVSARGVNCWLVDCAARCWSAWCWLGRIGVGGAGEIVQILEDDQYRAMSFIAAANRGGNRPTDGEVHGWLTRPRPKPMQKGPLIKRGRPAKYRTVGGVPGMLSGYATSAKIISDALAGYSVVLPHIDLPTAEMLKFVRIFRLNPLWSILSG